MKYIYYLLLLLTTVQCNIDKAYGPDDEVQPEEIISVITTPTKAEADGFTIIDVVATLPSKTKSAQRLLTFSTTLGTFVGINNPVSLSNVKINQDGKATVQLKAPSSPGIAIVTVESGDYRATTKITFEDPKSENKLRLNASSSVAEADSYTIVVVEADLPVKTEGDNRSVTFTTSFGTFLGTANSTTASGIKIDQDGKARVQLKAPSTPGIAIVSAEAGNYRSAIEITFIEPRPENRLQLELSTPNAEADGSSIVNIKVKLPTRLEGTARSIKLTTTAGTFAGFNGAMIPDLRVNSNGEIIVPLQAPNRPGIAFISAETIAYKQTTTIDFKTAYATKILLDPANLVLKAGNEQFTTLQVKLLRPIGTPSPGAEVTLKAYDMTGIQPLDQGLFRNVTLSNDSGVITASFTAGNTSYRGKVILQATLNVPNGPPVQGENSVIIISP